MKRRVAALLLPLLLACGGAPGSGALPSIAAAPTPTDADFAPMPFTAVQIRDASKVGRTYDYKVDAEGQPVRHKVIRIMRADPDEAEIQTRTLDEEGKEVEPPKTAKARWDDLRHHAAFPRTSTTVGTERVTVPAGTFDCMKYVVTKGVGLGSEVSTFNFATTMPGPPVLFFTEKAGQRVTTSTLVAYTPGA